MVKRWTLLSVLLFLALPAQAAQKAEPVHALALHGAPKYGAGFDHLEYVNPQAPKGGTLKLAAKGTFDNLNPYILKGVPAPGVGMTFQTLLTSTADEAFSEYGLIAESVEVPSDKSSVTFNLRKIARFNDGAPITSADVIWTFNTLIEKGHPFFRAYYAHVKEAVADGPHRVTFIFDMTGNNELPLIMGQMPVLPKHVLADKDFAATTLTPIVGSGPYRIASLDPGRRIVYERVKDWWAKDLPITRGQYNFDTIDYSVFLDETVLLQAFFSGVYDLRIENTAKAWVAEYDGQKPVRQGLIVKEEIPHDMPAGMQGYVFNTRRPIFADPLVRRALNYAFDFEWSNRQFAHGTYKRSNSYFSNSELASSGLPEGQELEILNAFRDQLPPEVFTEAFANPVTDGSGPTVRANLSTARKLLQEAGWKPGKNGMLEKDGQAFRFQIMLDNPAFERWTGPFVANLKKLGIEATMRVVDTAQYQNRLDSFDFDMVIGTFGQSLSPGNEQLDFWGSSKADVKGSRNLIGIKNPVIDELIKLIIAAPTREELIATTRALDRVLLWGHYVIPQWHIDYYRVAYWNKFGRPAVTPKYGLGLPETWWFDTAKAAAVDARLPEMKEKE